MHSTFMSIDEFELDHLDLKNFTILIIDDTLQI